MSFSSCMKCLLKSIKCLLFFIFKKHLLSGISTFFNANIACIEINIFSDMSPASACNFMYVGFDLIVQTRSKEYPLTDYHLIDH